MKLVKDGITRTFKSPADIAQYKRLGYKEVDENGNVIEDLNSPELQYAKAKITQLEAQNKALTEQVAALMEEKKK